MLGIVPEAAITYGFYDMMKEWAGKGRGVRFGRGDGGDRRGVGRHCGDVPGVGGFAADDHRDELD